MPDTYGAQHPALEVLVREPKGGSQNAARGKLLEDFFASLVKHLGFASTSTRVRRNGAEIDLEAKHALSGRGLIAELKAYSAPVPLARLKEFAGAFAADASDTSDGFFVALPHLTAEGEEFATKLSTRFPNFRYLAARDVVALLQEHGLLPEPSAHGPHADLTVLVTPFGLALAARALDPQTLRPDSVSLWVSDGRPSEPLKRLVAGSSFARGLPIREPNAAPNELVMATPALPNVVTVRASRHEFEYQFPASPKYFVGREPVIAALLERFTESSQRAEVFVVNAQSGWGKSSLALKLAWTIRQDLGAALVVDSRTADGPDFITAAFEVVAREAHDAGVLRLPEDSAFSSPASALDALSRATWSDGKRVLLFFDQFENVFRSFDLTRHFRDLALMVAEAEIPLLLGFAWKTDLVAFTEDHPYALRDDIRGTGRRAVLEPFSPVEMRTLLGRLEQKLDTRLNSELKTRVSEYSQGLPWLVKKLLGHLLTEIHEKGVTQEQLLAQDLNVQHLFEADLSELSAAEQAALKHIAHRAPILVTDLHDVVSEETLRSLIHARLVVQVGERIDVYWDIFRDFLTNGHINIQDSYVMRQGPASVGRLLRAVIAAGGEMSVSEAARAMSSTGTVVLNCARELRMLRLAEEMPGRVRLDPSVLTREDPEQAVRVAVARSLRRHKVHGVVSDLLEKNGNRVPVQTLAEHLPSAFPTVPARPKSWLAYARSFAQWLHYAELFVLTRDGEITPAGDALPDDRRIRLTVRDAGPARLKRVFPGAPAGPSFSFLYEAIEGTPARIGDRARIDAIRDLRALGAIEAPAGRTPGAHEVLVTPTLITDGRLDVRALRTLVERLPGTRDAMAALERDPELSPVAVGTYLRNAYGAAWNDRTTEGVGKSMRSWARRCGVAITARALPREPSEGQESLFDRNPD